ncbi:MAG: aminoglycoside phosphotransferase family protein [Gammaproteobacteria bacterium]|nr:aminoglycoside phosphotransferase family protein [Gammaproteobacteria bacterium]MCF6260124.1 aminoglycoside phosphotransferase family protein [Gammaproteobacteria bacterium]
MLSTANAKLVQRDQTIAGMKIIVDPDAFFNALNSAQPELNVSNAQLTYIRYRPTQFCLGAYQVRIPNANTPLLVHATAYNDKRWSKLPIVSGNHHIELQSQVLLSIFPGDSKLTSLASLMNPDNRQAIMRNLLPANVEASLGNISGDIKTLAYKPQRRYVGRVHFEHGTSALLKHYRERDYHSSAVANVIDSPTTARLRTPRILGRSQRHQSLLFEWFPGRLVDTETIVASTAASSLYAIGAALAEFHTLATDGLKQRTLSMKVNKLNTVATTIALLHPPLAAFAQDLATRIGQKLLQEVPVTQRIHGDFSPSQIVLLDQGQVAIIDHDENVCGNPIEDLGLFIACLFKYEHKGKIAPSQTELLIDAFIEGYQFTAQQQVTQTLHYHIATALFAVTHKSFRHHKPNWPQDIQAMLERVNDILHSPYSTN